MLLMFQNFSVQTILMYVEFNFESYTLIVCYISNDKWFIKTQSTFVLHRLYKNSEWKTNQKFSKTNSARVNFKKKIIVVKDIKINRIYSIVFLFSINNV